MVSSTTLGHYTDEDIVEIENTDDYRDKRHEEHVSKKHSLLPWALHPAWGHVSLATGIGHFSG